MFKRVFPLSLIISLRFFGLFLVIPLISLYATSMEGSTPVLVGAAVGGYALTQAMFQLPFGLLSDKFGRKTLIYLGLLFFFIGSVICALSTTIEMLLVGRFLQGAGAIGSVIVAMISDLVEERIRTKAMAIMGASIAMSFALAMGLGPIISTYGGLETLFWITAAIALLSAYILASKVPNPPKIEHVYEGRSSFVDVLKEKNLFALILGGAAQKGLMSAVFVITPLLLTSPEFGWQQSELWKVYIPAMLIGLLGMGPSVVIGEKRNKPKVVFLIAIFLFAVSLFLIGFSTNASFLVIGVALFFLGFNMLEPLLQSLITKFAKVHQKGTALGIANTFSYFGTFLGATIAAILLDYFGKESIGLVLGSLSLLWFVLTFMMHNPPRYEVLYIPEKELNLANLRSTAGSAEWYLNKNEGVMVVKFIKGSYNEAFFKAS